MARVGAVDVVIVAHGGAADLPTALRGVRAQGAVIGRVVVVDNDSPDGAADVAAAVEGVEVVRNPANVGYAPAMNQGFAATAAPFLLSLNADAELAPGYVDALVTALDGDGGAGAATGLLLLPEGPVDSTGIDLTSAYWAADRDRGIAADAVAPAPPFGVSGAAALWRRSMLDDVASDGAPWWDWLFAYWDDVELAWRARRRGWRMAFVPTALATHRRGADTAPARRTEALSLRNRLATVARHAGGRGLLRPSSLAVTGVTVLRLAVRHPSALAAAHPVAAVRAGLRARQADDAAGLPAAAVPVVPHPWRRWLRRQLTGRG